MSVGHPFETRLPATFAAAHVAVINTIMRAGGERVKWSRPSPCSADGCQYAFLYGNQLFFLFADIPEKPFEEAWRTLLMKSAVKANAIPCTMRLIMKNGSYAPVNDGWGLRHAYDDSVVSPPELETRKRIEMTDRELQALAVNLVCGLAEQQGWQIGLCHSLADVFPSVFMRKDGLVHAVVVGSARVPAPMPAAPAESADMKKSVPNVTGQWFFAPVRCAARDEDFEGPAALVCPLYRNGVIRMACPGLKIIS
jgi:hypothetical protein